MVPLNPLGTTRTIRVIEAFIKKTVQSETSSFAGGAFITDAEDIEKEDTEGNIPGWLNISSSLQ